MKRRIQYPGLAEGIVIGAPAPTIEGVEFGPAENPFRRFVLPQTGGFPQGIMGPAQAVDTGPFEASDFQIDRPLPQMGGGADAIFVSVAPTVDGIWERDYFQWSARLPQVVDGVDAIFVAVVPPTVDGIWEHDDFQPSRTFPQMVGGADAIFAPAPAVDGVWGRDDFQVSTKLPQMGGGADAIFLSAAPAGFFGADLGPGENPFREPKRYVLGGVDLGIVDVAPVDWAPEATHVHVHLRINRALFEPCVDLGIVSPPPVPLGVFVPENMQSAQFRRPPAIFPGVEVGIVVEAISAGTGAKVTFQAPDLGNTFEAVDRGNIFKAKT